LSRILLNQSAPKGLRQLLTGHDVKTAYEMGWDKIANGKLLAAAEAAGFAIIVSADQSIWRQQNMAGRKIALIVTTTNHWDTIKANPAGVIAACAEAGPGRTIVVPFPKPPRRRRPTSPRSSQ
jgi:hypothetical protein